MRASECVSCTKFPCADVKHECYIIPDVDIKPEEVSIVMISEAAPTSGEFYFQGKRVLPSYLQAGPSFFIEKSKRKMIAEDIATALSLVA